MVRMTIWLAAIVAALTFTGTAGAKAPANLTFAGATAVEQQQVVQALSVSKFDFSQLPAPITVHVVPPSDPHLGGGADAGYSTPGDVWLSNSYLDFGQGGWGTVQHEFAHEVDYYLLTPAERTTLLQAFGATSWCDPAAPHDSRPCEWFAGELAWAFWLTPTNSQEYTSISSHISPTTFRSILDTFGLAKATKVCTIHTVRGHWARKHGLRVWIRRHTVRACTMRP